MLVSVVAIIGAFLLIAPAPAVGAIKTANTLKVSPVRSDIDVKAGSSRTVKITVTNLTDNEIMVHPIENDFISGDESGTPALILDEGQFAPTHSLKRFMKPLADFTIPAKDSKTISVDIAVPASAQAGGYFGAVRFAPTTPDAGGQVNLSASVASLMLLTVPGDAIEKLELTDFDIEQNGKSGTYFTTPDNIEAMVRFRNDGNVQLGPFGKITVKNGNDVVYETDFNSGSPRDMVLPDSARRWNIPLEKIGDFGHYTVNATFTYGSKNQTLELNQSFWVVPMGIIIAIVGGVVGLIALIAAIWFFLRSYKKRILQSNSHRKRSGYSSRR